MWAAFFRHVNVLRPKLKKSILVLYVIRKMFLVMDIDESPGKLVGMKAGFPGFCYWLKCLKYLRNIE